MPWKGPGMCGRFPREVTTAMRFRGFCIAALLCAAAMADAGDFVVSTLAGGDPGRPAIAMGPAGDFLAVWPQAVRTRVRRYGIDGVPQGPEAIIDDDPFVIARGEVAAARLADGSYVATWSTFFNAFPVAGVLPNIYTCEIDFRRLASDGSPVGTPTTISSTDHPVLSCPLGTSAVAAQPDGSVVILYEQPTV